MHKENLYFNLEGLPETAVISFELPYADWLEIEKSNEWICLERDLEEIRNKHIQKSRHMQVKK